MKHLWLILFVLLIVGCSKKPINFETTLVQRDGVSYTKDKNEPYSGPVFSLFDNGKKKQELMLKDGVRNGLFTLWYENGQKEFEGTFKGGKVDGLLTHWYDNGQIGSKKTFENGDLISQQCWDYEGNEYDC